LRFDPAQSSVSSREAIFSELSVLHLTQGRAHAACRGVNRYRSRYQSHPWVGRAHTDPLATGISTGCEGIGPARRPVSAPEYSC
jgi:hypothetical protein